MITDKDILKLKTIFITKEEFNREFNGFRKEFMNIVIDFKDAILSEIIKLRGDIAITTGYRGIIEDHEVRIHKLETKKSFST